MDQLDGFTEEARNVALDRFRLLLPTPDAHLRLGESISHPTYGFATVCTQSVD